MADKRFRFANLVPLADGDNGGGAIVFVAHDNGDGTFSLNVEQSAAVAPSNYAQETGGNLDAAIALLGDIKTAVGMPTDAAVTNPAASASMIALLKGLLP